MKKGGIIRGIILLVALGTITPNLQARFDARPEQSSVIVVLRGRSLSTDTPNYGGDTPYRGIASRPRQIRDDLARRRRHLEDDQRVFEERLRRRIPNVHLRRRYTGLLNGLCLDLPKRMVTQLQAYPEVLSVVPNRRYRPYLTQSHTLMQVPEAWQQLGGPGRAGEGIKIGIMDTGIDHTHIMFDDTGYHYPPGFPLGDTAFTSRKIIVARVFTQAGDPEETITPRDLQGHGTDVASCAAGNLDTPSPLGPISGVAPNAYLGNYKIFTSDFTSLEQILAALEACVEDGMDVINLSLGTEAYVDSQLDPEAIAVRNAIHAGVVIVAAAGNSGQTEGIGSPGQLPELITVGSVTNSHAESNAAGALMNVYAAGERIVTEEPVVLGPNPSFLGFPVLGRFSLADADSLDGDAVDSAQEGLVCAGLPAHAVEDAWIFVKRGICTFSQKINSVQSAGGRGALIYNPSDANEPEDQPVAFPSVPGTRIPSYFTSWLTGAFIKRAFTAGGPVEVEFLPRPVSARQQTPLELSEFSALGPSLEFGVKPDILAVGEGSYGATLVDPPGSFASQFFEVTSFDPSGFSFSNGTSFSAPRISGAAALLKQKHPEWTPADVKSALVISASRPPSIASLSSMQRGGGHADAGRAIDLPLLVTPATLSRGLVVIEQTRTVADTIQLKNASERSLSVSLSYAPLGGGRVSPAEITPDALELAPFERADVRVSLTLPAPPQLGAIQDTEGDLLIRVTDEVEPLRVPVWARSMRGPARAEEEVLLVDDDGAEGLEATYAAAFDEAGYGFVHWDVERLGHYPPQPYMQGFPMVVWFMGSTSLNSSPDDVSAFNRRIRFNVAMTRYLTRGGRLLLSGMDWSDQQEDSTFAQQVLHLRQIDRDAFASFSRNGALTTQQSNLSIVGLQASPITLGLSGLNAQFDSAVPNFTDILSLDGSDVARPAFITNRNPRNVIGMTVESASYRAVFCAFPLERLSAENMNGIVKNSLGWLTEGSRETLTLLGVAPERQTDNGLPLKATLDTLGLNFLMGHDVFFDEHPIPILAIDPPDRVDIEVPSDLPAGQYDVTLQSPDGQRTTLPDAFTVGPTD